MRTLTLARFAMLCLIGVLLWMRPTILRAQFGSSECDNWSWNPEYCDDITGNDNCEPNSNFLAYPQEYLGEGTELVQYESLTCTLIPGDQQGTCNSASDLDVEENPTCSECSGLQCDTDNDCPCDGYICYEDWGTCEPNY